jgi:hypothetical protein
MKNEIFKEIIIHDKESGYLISNRGRVYIFGLIISKNNIF